MSSSIRRLTSMSENLGRRLSKGLSVGISKATGRRQRKGAPMYAGPRVVACSSVTTHDMQVSSVPGEWAWAQLWRPSAPATAHVGDTELPRHYFEAVVRPCAQCTRLRPNLNGVWLCTHSPDAVVTFASPRALPESFGVQPAGLHTATGCVEAPEKGCVHVSANGVRLLTSRGSVVAMPPARVGDVIGCGIHLCAAADHAWTPEARDEAKAARRRKVLRTQPRAQLHATASATRPTHRGVLFYTLNGELVHCQPIQLRGGDNPRDLAPTVALRSGASLEFCPGVSRTPADCLALLDDVAERVAPITSSADTDVITAESAFDDVIRTLFATRGTLQLRAARVQAVGSRRDTA